MLNSESMCNVRIQHVWHMYIFAGTGVGERVSYPRVHADDGFEALDTVDQLVPEAAVVHAHLGPGLRHCLQGALTHMYLHVHVHSVKDQAALTCTCVHVHVLHYVHKG